MKKKIFVFSFFILLLGISFFDIINNEKEFSTLENRNLKKKPKVTIGKILDGSYNKELNEYINDQFIGRNNFINIKSIGEEFLGKLENNGVIYGDNGYMFFKTDKLDKKQIEKNTKAIKKFIDKYDFDSKVMLVPYSSAIYNEYLPIGAPIIDDEKIIKDSYKNLSEENTIDVLDILNENKNKEIYYKTDHHWTTYGSYLAYLEYCKKKNIKAIDIGGLKENSLDGFLGTYYRRSKKFNSKTESIKYYDMDNLSMEINGEFYNSLYVPLKENNEDKHSIFLKGNNPLTVIKNKDKNVKGKKLIVFKDSFANSFIPFVANHYEEVHVIDLRHFNGKVENYIKENSFTDALILYSVNSLNKDSNIIKIAY